MSLAVRKATANEAIAAVNDSMCDIVRFVKETTEGDEDYDVHLRKRTTDTHFTCTTQDPETKMQKIAEVHSRIRTEHTVMSQSKAIFSAGASAAETGGQILGNVKQYVEAQVYMAVDKTMTGVTSTSRKISAGAVVTVGGACNFLKRSFVTACKVGLMIADDADANKRARVHSGDSGEDAPADEKAGVDKKKVKDDDPDSAASVSAELNQERNDQQSDDGIEQGEASASGDSASGGSASAAKLNQERNDQQSDDGIEQGEASASGDSASGDSASGDSASGGSASAANASAANASAANASAAAGMSVESLINSDSAANASGH